MTKRPAPRRRPLNVSTKLAVALRALGYKDEHGINWSHEPAIQLRAINEAGTDYKPPQLHPDYIFIRPKADHDRLTFKDNGTGRGDISAIAHTRRVSRKNQDHVVRMQAKLGMNPAPAEKRKSNWPKGRKLQSRNTFQRRRT